MRSSHLMNLYLGTITEITRGKLEGKSVIVIMRHPKDVDGVSISRGIPLSVQFSSWRRPNAYASNNHGRTSTSTGDESGVVSLVMQKEDQI